VLAPASGSAALPSEVSVAASPPSVSWPDSPNTTLEVSVSSGPEGADFQFNVEPDNWSTGTISGNPFFVEAATLEGPGNLKIESTEVADPSPTSCFRGGFQGVRHSYRLTLPADSESVIRVPVRALSAELPWARRGVTFSYPSGDGSRWISLYTPIAVNGPKGTWINFAVRGLPKEGGELTAGRYFRIAGKTLPSLARTKIVIVAEPRMIPNGFPRVSARTLATVRTNGGGNFLTPRVRLPGDAAWVLKAIPKTGPDYDDEPSCGPVITTARSSRPAHTSDLLDRYFRSISVKGTKLIGQKKVWLHFERRAMGTDPDDGIDPYLEYVMMGSAGCNAMGGPFTLKNGRLRWSGQIEQTLIGCQKPIDAWLEHNLRRGMKARMVRGRLVLTNKRGVKIVLRETDR